MKKILLLTLMLTATILSFGQAKKITIEEIWDKYYFTPRGVPGYTAMPNSDYYTTVSRAGIERYSFATGEQVDMILTNADLNRLSGGSVNISKVSGYEFSSDEKKMMIAVDEESIWRRSTLAFYYVYDVLHQVGDFIIGTI